MLVARLNVFFYSRANILLSSVPAASKLVGLASILMCCMSAISAIMLSVQHDGLTKAIGGRAVRPFQTPTSVYRS